MPARLGAEISLRPNKVITESLQTNLWTSWTWRNCVCEQYVRILCMRCFAKQRCSVIVDPCEFNKW